MSLKEVTAVYSENHINTLETAAKMQLLAVKEMEHIISTGFKELNK
jgi:hypothetical protein